MEKELNELCLAVLCQRYFRGINGRETFLLRRWEKYNLAAYRIQRAFRSHQLQSIHKENLKNKKSKLKIGPLGNKSINPIKSWISVMENKGTHEEKMSVWRNIVELRRAHRRSSTELCIKALIQSQGELGKAITLLGSTEFSFQSHFGPPLDEEMKESMNPYRKSSIIRDEELDMLLRQRSTTNSTRRAHRHLQQTLQTSAQFTTSTTREEYDLEEVILRAYYTKGNQPSDSNKAKGKKSNSFTQSTRNR
jgi:hypothetical protein